MKYEYKETASKIILANSKRTFKVDKFNEENQDHNYNVVLAYITKYERIDTLTKNDMQNINLFMNTAKHVPKMNIKYYLKNGGGTMANKSKKKITKPKTQKQEQEVLSVGNLGSSTKVEPTGEQHALLNMEQIKKCPYCKTNQGFTIKRQVWGNTIITYNFEGKEKDVINNLDYETSKRVYCSNPACSVCLGTTNQNVFLDIGANQLFIKTQ